MELHEHKLMPHLRISPRPAACPESIITYGGYRITVLTDRLFRVECGAFSDEATQAVWYREFPPVSYTHRVDGENLMVQTSEVTLTLNLSVFSKSQVTLTDGSVALLDNAENLFGTCSTLDTNGTYLCSNPAITKFDRAHIPLDMGVCARNGVAVYDDAQSLLLYPTGKLSPRCGGMDSYIFAYGHDYKGAVKALYQLCGRTPVVPRWALGNWWCRYWPYTQQEYLNLMDNFADDHIPISVGVIDMDWHHVHVDEDFGIRKQGLDSDLYGGTNGWTGYTWNKKLFPNHVAFLKELHNRGMHTTLNLHPALGVRWYEKPYPEMAEYMGMDPEAKKVVPFRIADECFVNGYLNILHHPLEEEGVDFWWVDWQQGKDSGLAGLDPLWALNHYHYLDSVHRRGEGLILSRYAGVGSHRYPVGFSGDIHMDWEFLDYMPYFTATAANIGYGWWSHDIGGHFRGLRDEELYLRWLQFGVFSPINRVHCCPAVVTSKEPWTLTAPVRAIAEKWFRFRHKLVPYLYSASWKNTLEGIPLIRPMYYVWPEEDAAYEADHQYLFGELLVAPITERSKELGAAEKKVWLPEGTWTDIFTNLTYTGGRWITVYRDSGSMPVFAKAGTILPLDPKTSNSCPIPEELDVFVYTGTGEYRLFEENGAQVSFDARLIEKETQRLIISGGIPRKYHIYFKNVVDGTCSLHVNGDDRALAIRHNRCLQAVFEFAKGESAQLTVTFQKQDPLTVRQKHILNAFIQLPMDNWEKEKQWDIGRNCVTAEDFQAWIQALDLPDTGKNILRERVTAMEL